MPFSLMKRPVPPPTHTHTHTHMQTKSREKRHTRNTNENQRCCSSACLCASARICAASAVSAVRTEEFFADSVSVTVFGDRLRLGWARFWLSESELGDEGGRGLGEVPVVARARLGGLCQRRGPLGHLAVTQPLLLRVAREQHLGQLRSAHHLRNVGLTADTTQRRRR